MVGRKRALRLLTVDLLLLHAAHRGWKGSAQPAQDPGRQARSDGLEHTTVHCQLCRCYQPVALHPTPLPKGYAKFSKLCFPVFSVLPLARSEERRVGKECVSTCR